MNQEGRVMEEIGFSAYLPEIQSAISIGGDGARLKLDVPESELAAIVKLAAYGRGKVLRVTISDNANGNPVGE